MTVFNYNVYVCFAYVLTHWSWNSSELRKAELSYSRFRRSLKTFLFRQSYHSALWTFLTAPYENILTYLLINVKKLNSLKQCLTETRPTSHN